MWLVGWILSLALDLGALVLHLVIVSHLVEFEVDHVNPLDLAYSLERYINPILVCEAAVALLSLSDLLFGLPLILGHAAVVAYIFYLKQKRSRIFDPMTIVRDIGPTKVRHVVCAIVCAFGLAWILVCVILWLLL